MPQMRQLFGMRIGRDKFCFKHRNIDLTCFRNSRPYLPDTVEKWAVYDDGVNSGECVIYFPVTDPQGIPHFQNRLAVYDGKGK